MRWLLEPALDPREVKLWDVATHKELRALPHPGCVAIRKAGPARHVPLDAGNLEFLCQWSRRWQDAERAIHKAKDKQVAASLAHCDKLVTQGGDIAPYEVAEIRFHRLEAEKGVV